MAWATSDLLTEVRRAAMLPASSNSATADADILAQADRAMQSSLVPLLLSTQEEYLVRKLTTTVTAGTAAYAISRRAVGSRLRNASVLVNGVRRQLARLRPEELEGLRTDASGYPVGFYLDAAELVLVPTPNAAVTLETWVYVRPGRLTASTNHRALTAVTAGADYLGAAAPTKTRLQWTSALAVSTLGTTLDITSARPPFESKALDLAYSSAGGSVTSIDVLTASLLSTPAVGDIVSPVDESSVVQLPVELHPLLFQRTAQFLLEQLGYGNEAGRARDTADRMEGQARAILTPRSDGNPQKLTGGVHALINRRGLGGW
jgi:hypothetical protein